MLISISNNLYLPPYHLKQIAGQRYHPFIEVSKGDCRQIAESLEEIDSPRCYYSSDEKDDEEGKEGEMLTPRLILQMDTERSCPDSKTCLEYCYENPLQVS